MYVQAADFLHLFANYVQKQRSKQFHFLWCSCETLAVCQVYCIEMAANQTIRSDGVIKHKTEAASDKKTVAILKTSRADSGRDVPAGQIGRAHV
mgnify:FL=1